MNVKPPRYGLTDPADILAEQLRLIAVHDAARKAWRGSVLDIPEGFVKRQRDDRWAES